MKFEELQTLKVAAMKSGDKPRVKVLNDIIVLVQKEQTKGKVKVEATEEMVAACALKTQKTLEEMVATCPDTAEYAERLADYRAQLAIAAEYAPKILDVLNNEYGLEKKNKGVIMKIVMPVLKGKVDMAVANKVIGEMLQ